MLKLSCLLAILGLALGWAPVGNHDFQDFTEGQPLSISLIPRSTPLLLPTFSLFTRQYPQGISLNLSNLNLLKADHQVKFIVHGWKQTPQEEYIQTMTQLYLKKADVNVVVVNWTDFSSEHYNIAAGSTQWVGKTLGDLIIAMMRERQMVPDQMHILGHGMGGHVAGFAGQQVQSVKNEKLNRITGLDVAGKLFMDKPKHQRLSDDDAVYVDVIHTYDITQSGGYGYPAPLGTVDFYPNGGNVQVGCFVSVGSTGETKNQADVQLARCNHYRATEYYIESMTCGYSFVAKQSDSWEDFLNRKWDASGVMGEKASRTLRGKYYLSTNGETPFAKGSDTIPIRNQQE